jgi:hypothetical protein
MPRRLIALVTVIAIVDGLRTTFEPGSPLPEDLPAHDVAELKKMGSIEDLDETDAADKATRKGDKAASLEFEKARKDVAAQLASIAAPPKKGEGATE